MTEYPQSKKTNESNMDEATITKFKNISSHQRK